MFKEYNYTKLLIFLCLASFLWNPYLQAQASFALSGAATKIENSTLKTPIQAYSPYQLDVKTLHQFVSQHQNQTFELQLSFGTATHWDMVLQASKVHGDEFYAISPKGEKVALETNITYKGFLKNEPAIQVRLTISENWLHGYIFDKERHIFEKINKTTKHTNSDVVIVYKDIDQSTSTPTCGNALNTLNNVKPSSPLPTLPNITPLKQPQTGTTVGEINAMGVATYCPKLGVALDWQGFQIAGSLATFNNDLQTVLNIVNGYHAQYNVEFELTPLYTVMNAPNPWTDDPCCNGEQNMYNFKDWAQTNFPYPFTCNMLFTGQDFNGINWGMINTMCSNIAASQVDYHYSSTITQKANLATHELGHIWGLDHVSTSSLYIMSPTVWDGNLAWHPTSDAALNTAVNNTFTACLPTCGGGTFYPSTVIRGPYLQSSTPQSIIVKWRTSNSTDSKIWYGNSPTNLTDSLLITGSRTDHEILLNGLSASTTYYYAIGDGGGQMEGLDSDHYFKTAPVTGTAQNTKIWVLGDCGTGNSNAMAVRDQYYNYVGTAHTDMILMLGDNAYNNGTDAEYQTGVFDIYTEKLKNSVLWSCPGNHEFYNGYTSSASQSGPYFDIFSLPTAAEAGGVASGTEAYYSFDYGNVHVVSLDSHDSDRSVGGLMLNWLDNDLAATLQDWIIVIFHHPPYSKGSHDSDTESKLIEMRENVLPILESYDVDLVLSGHSHAYERSKLIHGHYGYSSTFSDATMAVDAGDGRLDGTGAYQQNTDGEGTVYIVTGSAGKTSSMSGTHPIMYYSDNNLGSTILNVNGGQLDVQFLNSNGIIEDYLTLIKNGVPLISWINPINEQVFTNLDPINFSINAVDNDGTITQVVFLVDDVPVNTDMTAPYSFVWTPPTYGTYTLTATTTDNDGLTNTTTIDITVQDGASIDISVPISNGNDDVEERVSDGYMYMNSSDIEIVDDTGSQGLQKVGLRFPGVQVPENATIVNAYIQFTAESNDPGPCAFNIYTEAADNALTFNSNTYDVSSRALSNGSVSWSPDDWVDGAAGTIQQSPNLNAIIQEVVDRSGWTWGNALAFVITGSGERSAYSYETSPTQAAILHITYIPTVPCAVAGDMDGDGVCADEDCNDNDPSIYPGASCDDGNPATGSDVYTAACLCEGVLSGNETSIVEVFILDSSDDVEERESDGYVYMTSSDIELVDDYSTGQDNQTVGLRFNNITVPPTAVISNAYLQFTTDGSDSDVCNLTIHGHDHANSPAFQNVVYDVSNRATTSAVVNWAPAAWVAGTSGIAQQSPDLQTIVQEIIGQGSWANGNSITFLITGTGVRDAESYDNDPSKAAKLFIEYCNDGDGDGFCAGADCDDTNAAIYVGATCDDGNANTTNDMYNSACNCTGTVIVTPPNLTYIAGSSTLNVTGTTVSLSTTIINDGTVAAGANQLSYYLSANTNISTSDYLIGTSLVSALSAGQSSPQNFTMDVANVVPSIPDGTYYVGYLIDQTNMVSESNETDNSFHWTTPQVTITQTPSFLNVSPNMITIGASAGSITFDISSNTSWTVNESSSWLSVTTSSGSNNSTITINYNANTGGSNQTATITVSGIGVTSQTVQITQTAATVTDVYDLQFTDVRQICNPNTGSSSTCVNLQIRSAIVGAEFAIGSHTVFFNYNTAAVNHPSYNATNFNETNLCALGETIAPYLMPNFSYDEITGEGNLTTLIQIPNFGCPTVTNDWLNMGSFCFEVIDEDAPLNLSFNTSQTFLNQNDETPSITQGSLFPLNVPTPSCTLPVQIHVFLEGPYNTATGLMNTALFASDLLPLQQPYNRTPWHYNGSESVNSFDDLPANSTDWVLLELRDETDNSIIVAQKAAILLADGNIVEATTGEPVQFANLPIANYYIIVRHHNHLDVMSSTAISFANGVNYDFTTASGQAMGGNQMALVDGKYMLFGGDFDSNGLFTVTDANLYNTQASMLNVYVDSDANLDKSVTVMDYNIFLPNASIIGVSLIRY